jgi:hypothetical protein
MAHCLLQTAHGDRLLHGTVLPLPLSCSATRAQDWCVWQMSSSSDTTFIWVVIARLTGLLRGTIVRLPNNSPAIPTIFFLFCGLPGGAQSHWLTTHDSLGEPLEQYCSELVRLANVQLQ